MKLSKYIASLQEILDTEGDLDCYYSIDDEGNGYQQVHYDGTVLFIFQRDVGSYRLDDVYSDVDAEEYLSEEIMVPIVVVN